MIAGAFKLETIKLFTNLKEDVEQFSLTSIADFCNTLRNSKHYSKFIIDISAFENNDTDSEIISSLYLLKSSSETPIIVIAQGRVRGDKLLSDLVEMGIYNFITSVQADVVQSELAECINGRSFDDVKHFIVQEEHSKIKKSFFNKIIPAKKSKQVISIAVLGVLPRIGTTTQAIRICKAISSLGHKACYVEHNSNGHIAIIKEVFSQAEAGAENENMVTYNDVTMFYNSTPNVANYEYIVYDYGCIPQDIVCDIKIVVAGATAWELTALAERMDKDTDNTFYIFSFTDKQEQPDILDFMGTSWTRTLFADYCPDMFSAVRDTEKQEFKKLLDLIK